MDEQRNLGAEERTTALVAASETKWILLFCVLAALHVYVFSAAFPFFNNVDEQAHFDLALRYSHGNIPRTMVPFADEAMPYFGLYSAAFYLGPATHVTEFLPPPWEWPPEKQELMIHAARATMGGINQESSQPPLYYALAGAWWRLSGWFAPDPGHRLYWLRFLNVPIMALLVWLGWVGARLVFGDDLFPRLAVPALIAFLPQSAFYSIQSDVLSPVCCGTVFVCLVRLLRGDACTVPQGLGTGLALASCYLAKSTNLPFLAAAVLALGFIAWERQRSGKLRTSWPSFAALAICAAVPAGLWMAWCQQHFGSLTGSQPKVTVLGWTVKPFGEWWHHPLFTVPGLWNFFSKLTASFWQGEMMRHGRPLEAPLVSAAYVSITWLFLAAAVFFGARRSGLVSPLQRRALGFSLLSVVAMVGFLGGLSIIYDFHDCFRPSRAEPFFTSGRMILGVLIPFLLLLVYGLERMLNLLRLGLRAKLCALAGLVAFMSLAEITVNWPVFSKSYNYFHMSYGEASR
jgi:hypothetical protein